MDNKQHRIILLEEQIDEHPASMVLFPNSLNETRKKQDILEYLEGCNAKRH